MVEHKKMEHLAAKRVGELGQKLAISNKRYDDDVKGLRQAVLDEKQKTSRKENETKKLEEVNKELVRKMREFQKMIDLMKGISVSDSGFIWGSGC